MTKSRMLCAWSCLVAVVVGVEPPAMMLSPHAASLPAASVVAQKRGIDVGTSRLTAASVASSASYAPRLRSRHSIVQLPLDGAQLVARHDAQASHSLTLPATSWANFRGVLLLAAVVSAGMLRWSRRTQAVKSEIWTMEMAMSSSMIEQPNVAVAALAGETAKASGRAPVQAAIQQATAQEDTLEALRVVELRERCRSAGLPVEGIRAKLIERLKSAASAGEGKGKGKGKGSAGGMDDLVSANSTEEAKRALEAKLAEEAKPAEAAAEEAKPAEEIKPAEEVEPAEEGNSVEVSAEQLPRRERRRAPKPIPDGPDDQKRFSRGALAQRLRWRKGDDQYIQKYLEILREEGHLETKTVEGIKGFVATMRSLEHGGHWQHVLDVLGELREKKPNVNDTDILEHSQVAHHVAISSCSRALNWQRALMVMEEMPLAGFNPDFETYQAASQACSKSNKWEAALSILARAQDEKKGNHESYTIGMMACARAKAWEASLSLLADADVSPLDDMSRDASVYSIAIFACMGGGEWQRCVDLLEEMERKDLKPDGCTYGCVARACKEAGQIELSRKYNLKMRQLKLYDVDEILEPPWTLDTPEMRAPMPLVALQDWAPKEISVFNYVRKRATPGDLDSVLLAIESFAAERKWLKIQGDDKRRLLEENIRAGDRIVEFGCYVGYSSMLMARRLRQLGGTGSVTTCEVDAAVAYIARAMHIFAGVESEVQVRVGCAADWIKTGQLGSIDFLLLDHRGTVYHDDLYAAEPALAENCRVWADNVLHPGAPLFIWYVHWQGYKITVVPLKEFLRDDLDDWVLICEPPPRDQLKPWPTELPWDLKQLSKEVDEISWKSSSEPVDWVGFQDKHIKPVFYKWKEEHGY